MAAKTYGTVSPERQKAMSGLEFVEGLATGVLPLNTIAQTLGYDVVEAESGRVAITLQPTGAHLNPWGTVHGGLAATILDSCMGLAIQSTLDKGVGSTTLEFKISLLRAITLETGKIRAEGVSGMVSWARRLVRQCKPRSGPDTRVRFRGCRSSRRPLRKFRGDHASQKQHGNKGNRKHGQCYPWGKTDGESE
jgi:uncharacterized protein (TIGR00369 family)